MLELGLKFQLIESVDVLGHVDMVAVGDIALVGDAGDDAEAPLEALGELVSGGFQGGAIQGVVDILRLFPLGAFVVHLLHDGQGKGGGGGVRVALAGHVLHALVKARIAQGDGGIAVKEELVDGFALLQAGQGAVLPENGCGVGQGALQAVVAALQGPVAQLQALFKDAPELVQIPTGGQGHIRQVDGDHALVEAAVVLVLAGFVVFGVGDVADAGIGEAVRRQEGAAAHAGIHIALQFLHLLFGDVVRHHAAGGALGGQFRQVPVGGILGDIVVLQHIDELGESGGDPHAVFVLHALEALEQHFLDDHGQVLLFPLVPGLVEVHEHGDEGGLSVGGQQGDHLVLDGLHAPADLLPQAGLHQFGDLLFAGIHADGGHLRLHNLPDLLAADLHKGGQVGQGDGLAAILVGSHLCHDLGGDVAGGGEAVGPFDQGAGDDGAVLQHVLQVYQVAVVHVLGVIVGVVEVDDALPVGLHDLLGQQNPLCNVPAHLAGHVVPLGGIHHRVLVGVLLLGLLIAALDEGEDLLVGGIGAADQGTGIAVGDVVLGHLIGPVSHDLGLHQVLNLLHRGGAVHLLTAEFHGLRDPLDLHGGHPDRLVHASVGLCNGRNDLRDIKGHFRAVPFNDFHADLPPYTD